jgi:hypothetical protein
MPAIEEDCITRPDGTNRSYTKDRVPKVRAPTRNDSGSGQAVRQPIAGSDTYLAGGDFS